MGLFRYFSVCVVAVVAVGAGTPAQADDTRSPVRYAGFAGCVCAPWKLWLRGGGVISLREARVFSTGKQRAPLALSPNGRHVAYFHRSTGALVVQEIPTGESHRVPGVEWSHDARVTRLHLAPGGRYVVLGVGRDNRIVDAHSGQAVEVPPGLRPWSFSPDARFVLMVDDGFRAGIYSMSPFAETGRVPVGGALGLDGAIVAHFTARESAIGLWDVVAGRATGAPIPLPAGKTPARLRWSGSGHLAVQMVTPRRLRIGGGARYNWYRVDPASGRTDQVSGFTVPGSVHNPIVTGLAP
ncbi:hypothetical protein FHS43_000385 [Streptosporangium becharense]|uniref:Uncharacterized protein n=1 Tax=Streptosporangium becharense TaxID=1816182 RepID=A0A7W9IFM3_9ACTN|nr:hypothetical protein [Streptosporangium becharense]MBB2909139.1 hypothetical protein [Streptosporangium becharense]MBB5819842.1 hypothetical protein [Streptosporangium becharense]